MKVRNLFVVAILILATTASCGEETRTECAESRLSGDWDVSGKEKDIVMSFRPTEGLVGMSKSSEFEEGVLGTAVHDMKIESCKGKRVGVTLGEAEYTISVLSEDRLRGKRIGKEGLYIFDRRVEEEE